MNIPLTPIRFLRYAEQQFPRTEAVVCGNDRFTYTQFAARVARLAGALREQGVAPGDRVAFLSTNCHRLLEAYYGVIDAGAVLLPLNVRLKAQELAFILNDAGAGILLLQAQFIPLVEAFRNDLRTVKSFIVMDAQPQLPWLSPSNYEALLASASPYRVDFTTVDENSIAEMFYTSGTSASPKGVMLTHRNIYMHAVNTALANRFEATPIQLHTIPLFHANGWGAAHFVTVLGGKHVMVCKFDPPEIFRLVQQEHVSHFGLVPAMATALVNCPERAKYDLSSLKTLNIGGAASSPTLVREVEETLGCTCFAGYGLTETSPALTIAPIKDGLCVEGEQRYALLASTGFAMPGCELRVVDEHDNDVPRDGVAVGEIVARGDGIMEGYWRQPEATAEAMRSGWFHTGDMATWNEDGYLLVVDRKKDIIVSGGENISSLEVEKTMLAHPSILELAIVPVPHPTWGEVPKALVVLKPGAQATENELIEFCRSRLAHYKCPHSIEFLNSPLPRTGTGKVLKRELRKRYWQGQQTIRPESVEAGGKKRMP